MLTCVLTLTNCKSICNTLDSWNGQKHELLVEQLQCRSYLWTTKSKELQVWNRYESIQNICIRNKDKYLVHQLFRCSLHYLMTLQKTMLNKMWQKNEVSENIMPMYGATWKVGRQKSSPFKVFYDALIGNFKVGNVYTTWRHVVHLWPSLWSIKMLKK